MKVLALCSMNGGVGRTTIAAGLARVASERLRTFAVDADPQNALGLHLGMPVGEGRGLVDTGFSAGSLLELLRSHPPEAPFIPFGRAPRAALAELDLALRADPRWLARRLEALCPSGTDLVVLDTPAGRGAWTEQALLLADAALFVLGADAASYATLPDAEGLAEDLALQRGPRLRGVGFVVNRLDPRRALSRDLRAAFGQALGERLLPTALYEDEAVREALAARQSAPLYAPHGQFTAGLRELFAWFTGATA